MTEQRLGISGLANHAHPPGLRHVQACDLLETLEIVVASTRLHVVDEGGVALILRFSGDLCVADVELHGFRVDNPSGLRPLLRQPRCPTRQEPLPARWVRTRIARPSHPIAINTSEPLLAWGQVVERAEKRRIEKRSAVRCSASSSSL